MIVRTLPQDMLPLLPKPAAKTLPRGDSRSPTRFQSEQNG
jgi:hypothetical protein